MIVRLATESDKERWDDFVMNVSDGSFLQSWFWGQLQKEQNNSFWRIIFEKDNEIQAVTMVIKKTLPFGGCWLYVPRGPVFGKTSEMSEVGKLWQDKILEMASKEKAVFVRCDPVWEDEGKKSWFEEKGWYKASREIQPQHTLVLGLEKSEEELMAGMHTKTRYNVRLAERKGVKVSFSTDTKDIDVFLGLSREVTKRSSFGYHPDNYYKTMLKALKENNMIEVAVAKHEGVALAANILVTFGGVATYAHGASSVKKRNVMAPQLLMWESIKRAKLNGAKQFDFYGVAPPESDKEHSWSGITRLKRGFSGERKSYIGAYDYVLRLGMYRVLNVARRIRGLVR
jgi:lipid II:glycine glycyltransferase (peptidoglycan interpeptide bridge formation enzyme)